LKTASTATLAALAAGAPRSLFAEQVLEKIAPTADRVIGAPSTRASTASRGLAATAVAAHSTVRQAREIGRARRMARP
jgi:hypothetical protein